MMFSLLGLSSQGVTKAPKTSHCTSEKQFCDTDRHENRTRVSYCHGFTVMSLAVVLARQQSPQCLPWVLTCQLHCSSSLHLDHSSADSCLHKTQETMSWEWLASVCQKQEQVHFLQQVPQQSSSHCFFYGCKVKIVILATTLLIINV